jgi:hypothetical protein
MYIDFDAALFYLRCGWNETGENNKTTGTDMRKSVCQCMSKCLSARECTYYYVKLSDQSAMQWA